MNTPVYKYLFVPAAYLPEGVGFSLYGREHLIWLAVLAIMCVCMIFFSRRMQPYARLKIARWIAMTLLILETLRDIYLAASGAWKWNYLPLHPCSFTMFFMVLWSWRPSKCLGNLMYGYGLVGAMCALLFCDWTDQPIWQFQTIYSFVFHGALVGWILMLLISGDIRPTGRGFFHSVLFLAIAAPFTAIFNYLLPDCNFFFTYAGSEGSPLALLIELFGEPWWLVAYAALALFLLAVEFLPWYLKERRAVSV